MTGEQDRRVGPGPGESLFAWVARVDPEVWAAVADVDRALLAESLATPPSVRLERCARTVARVARFRRVEPDHR